MAATSMAVEALPWELTVCKVADASEADLNCVPCFLGRTDAEVSLVCPTACVPAQTTAREDGWRAMRVTGQLDFSLVGILARLCAVLAERRIPVFCVSTYDTDYVLTKADRFEGALSALAEAGYEVVRAG